MKLAAGDGSDADLVICVKASDWTPYTDNAHGVCSMCGVAIQWRPDVPDKPKKVCLECGTATIEEHPDAEMLVTQTTIDEIDRYLKKQRH